MIRIKYFACTTAGVYKLDYRSYVEPYQDCIIDLSENIELHDERLLKLFRWFWLLLLARTA